MPLRDTASLSPGKQIETRLQAGKILSQVEEVTPS